MVSKKTQSHLFKHKWWFPRIYFTVHGKRVSNSRFLNQSVYSRHVQALILDIKCVHNFYVHVNKQACWLPTGREPGESGGWERQREKLMLTRWGKRESHWTWQLEEWGSDAGRGGVRPRDSRDASLVLPADGSRGCKGGRRSEHEGLCIPRPEVWALPARVQGAALLSRLHLI